MKLNKVTSVFRDSKLCEIHICHLLSEMAMPNDNHMRNTLIQNRIQVRKANQLTLRQQEVCKAYH